MSPKKKVWHFHRADLQRSKIFELRAVHVIDHSKLEHFFSFLIRIMFISLIFAYP